MTTILRYVLETCETWARRSRCWDGSRPTCPTTYARRPRRRDRDRRAQPGWRRPDLHRRSPRTISTARAGGPAWFTRTYARHDFLRRAWRSAIADGLSAPSSTRRCSRGATARVRHALHRDLRSGGPQPDAALADQEWHQTLAAFDPGRRLIHYPTDAQAPDDALDLDALLASIRPHLAPDGSYRLDRWAAGSRAGAIDWARFGLALASAWPRDPVGGELHPVP